MRNGRMYLCALFFLLLTALRLLYPAEAEGVRAFLSAALDPKGSCRALAETLGRELGGGGLRQGLVAAFEMAEASFL